MCINPPLPAGAWLIESKLISFQDTTIKICNHESESNIYLEESCYKTALQPKGPVGM